MGSLILRPYVFVFLAMSLVASIVHLGYARTAILFSLAWGVAFLSEFSATRIGFPYGYYEYLETTRDVELWLSNVPFFDSLSYSFIAYSAYSMALLVCTPVQRRGLDIQLAETHRIRQSLSVGALMVVFFVFLDIVTDPVALRGSRWFLGQIFWYPGGGLYFGVPLSNFLGWALVGVTIVLLFQGIDRALVKRRWINDRGVRHIPGKALFGPGLYYLLVCFNVTITFAIGEPLLGCVGVFIFTPVTAMLYVLLFQPFKQATSADLEAHRKDFPLSRLGLASSGEARGFVRAISPLMHGWPLP